jgi:hypothetical protein
MPTEETVADVTVVIYMPTEETVADVLTKALGKFQNEKLCKAMGLMRV